MIFFETQEEFERAVMEVVLNRLDVRPQLESTSVYKCGGDYEDVLEITGTDLYDKKQEVW